MQREARKKSFLHQHALSLTALGVVIVLIALYSRSDPATHFGSFFGNAIADWSGVCVTIIATKFLYERGSRESKQPKNPGAKSEARSPFLDWIREHSLTIFLVITGIAWVVAFSRMNPNSRWGQVVGNLVSEWTQILGLVLLTKRLIEVGSKEDSR